MDNKRLTYILSLIGIFVFIHYYCSLDLIWHFLGRFDLDIVSIISWEDIQFSIASITTKLIIFLFLAYLGISSVLIPILDSCNNTKKTMSKKSMLLMLFVIAFLFIIFFIFNMWYKSYLDYIMFPVILFGAGFAYSRYRILDIILLALVFIAMILFSSYIKNKCDTLYSNDVKLELTDGEVIETDNHHNLIFFGTKYVIIQVDSINAKLYPTNRIKEVEWINHNR